MPHNGRVVVALAQNDRHLVVQRDAVTQTRAAAFIGLDRLGHQRDQRHLKILRRLLKAHDEFVVGFDGGGNFAFE
jgi:hypothetical protein